MVNLTEQEFLNLKNSKKAFMLTSEFRGDEITPIKLFNALKGKRKFIFEAGSNENHFGRYSYLGESPYKEIMGETLKEIEAIKKEVSVNFQCNSPFTFKGGAIGYMGYDSVALYEKKLNFTNKDELNVPTIRFNFYKRFICYDHFTHKAYVIDNILNDDNRAYSDILKEQKEYFNKLLEGHVSSVELKDKEDIKIRFGTTKEEYMKKVEIAKEYIKAGDIFQVVPSQRMYCETSKSPIEIYRRLREENPSPYMFFIDYEDYQIIGSSPESLVSVRGREVATNPIAGTRKRGKTKEEDLALEKELIEDEKERAEHVMLVDLGRNDIGKVRLAL